LDTYPEYKKPLPNETDNEYWERMDKYEEEHKLGFWATPNTLDSMPPKSAEALEREATVARPGRSKPANLRDQVSNRKMWATASSRDWKDSPGMATTGENPDGSERNRTDQLARQVYQTDAGGSLNPTFVEWLMNYPKDWTAL
jgi:hypothetical protein